MSEPALYLRAAEELRGNAGQWAAYNAAGHCVVMAGPGSGKTKTLTIKMARILAEDVEEPRGGVGARKQVFVAALAIVTAEGA